VNIEVVERIEFFLSKQSLGRNAQAAPGLGVATLKGPREDNQDRAAVAQLSFPSGESFLIALICDGMGGMAKGGEAAGCAASSFIGCFVVGDQRPLKALLYNAVSTANKEVFRRFGGNGGTTLTAVAVGKDGAWIAHVGDSRLYEFGPKKALNLLTRDDTIGGQLRPTADEDILDNRLLQFVGVGPQIEPHILRVPDSAGPTFLLTSDGAHSIGKKALDGIVRNSTSAIELVRKVIFVAEAVGVEDNSSAVSISVAEFDPLPTFSNGVELTVWSPADKLEMWLGELRPSLSENRRNERPPSMSSPKPKKVNRARAKPNKKVEDNPNELTQEPEKPQLNIEFGSRDKDRS
jgi:serine/threonine protein phosphatase PrpC